MAMMVVDPERKKVITPENDWPEYRIHVLNFLTRLDDALKKLIERHECLKDQVADMRREHILNRRIVIGFVGLILIGFGSALIKAASMATGLFGIGRP